MLELSSEIVSAGEVGHEGAPEGTVRGRVAALRAVCQTAGLLVGE